MQILPPLQIRTNFECMIWCFVRVGMEKYFFLYAICKPTDCGYLDHPVQNDSEAKSEFDGKKYKVITIILLEEHII